MEKKGLVVTGLVVGLIGLLSVITGFAAEGTRIKASDVSYIPPDTCVYPRSSALGLGVTAALSLLVAHLTLSISTGCICCMRGPRPSGSKWILAVVFFVISWITFLIAFILLLVGAAFNGRHGEQSMDSGTDNCYVLRPGIFAVAAVMSLITLVLGMLYFFLLNYVKNEASAWSGGSAPPQANIAMGHPQFPQQQKTGHPGFVR